MGLCQGVFPPYRSLDNCVSPYSVGKFRNPGLCEDLGIGTHSHSLCGSDCLAGALPLSCTSCLPLVSAETGPQCVSLGLIPSLEINSIFKR